LRDLAKLYFFKLTITKLNFIKSVMTSFQRLHRHYVTETRHETNVTKFSILGPLNQNFWRHQWKFCSARTEKV